ncbi:MAG: hypothetical protein A3F84_23205 [Candidatus Handelsmanbacteria bacterium RIFCSPLOWO2_12_FULL_64_10]|uniref:Methyltransferase domain-containing protein n=1 Tax=Handelsmanbacteria sp. (strain RIFCSPLOWO2_12_FULL_64_10) TaxID=1817868 RepID=A0A1F6CLR9_HANXR|nr:MAG: hypothetical protein A3F84_23205 [Candidatus Handelsmanbacteria bacterium RIFCSPLOWO2_12_FULL_64_10]
MNRDLQEYYALRAEEYEKIYAHPAKQGDIAWLRALLQRLLAGRHVLEATCGTGYWTPTVAEVAASVLATDLNESVLEIARGKSYPRGNVRFQVADAFRLEGVTGAFDAGFAGFWWSHVSKTRLRDFLRVFHGRLQPGALAVFADNNYVEGITHPRSDHVDDDGNTYSRRTLESGRQYEVLKNFPTEAEVREVLSDLADDIYYFNSTFYWCVSYKTVS